MAFASVITPVTAGSSGGGNVTTAATNTAGCDFFVAVLGSYTGAAAPTITAEGGASANTWAYLTTYTGSNEYSRIAYTTNYPANTNGSHTFTGGSGAGSYPSIVVFGFSGARATSVFDAGKDSGAVNASATSIQPGSLTPSEDNCLVMAGLAWTNSKTPAIDGGFSSPVLTDYSAANHFGAAGSYLIQTSAAAANPTWSWSGATEVATSLGVFRAAAGGGGTNWGPWIVGGNWNRIVQTS